MSKVSITPKSRPSLVIDYGGRDIELSGAVPAEIIAAANQGRIRRGASDKERETVEHERGMRVMSLFIEQILPEDHGVDLEDIGTVFEAWSEHVGLGEGKNSTD